MDKIDELLTRGVDTIYPSKEELEKVLKSGKKLKLYQGFDPTGTQLHIGHMVGLRKLAQWQKAGHHVIFLIGDGTGQAGDPSGKTKSRDHFFKSTELRENAKEYVMQAKKIIDFDAPNVEILYNGDWLNKLTMSEILDIAGHFSLEQLSERDLFQERKNKGESINFREFMYPLLQGYDSVAMDVDLELGGTDQMFNMLAGRKLLKEMREKDKFVMTTPLLTDSKGVKIGKTEGNVIALTDSPDQLFGEIMALSDDVIVKGLEYLTDISMEEIKEVEQNLDPVKHKKLLAFEIVKQLNSDEDAKKAQEEFERIVQNKEMPQDVPAVDYKGESLIDFLVNAGLVLSRSEAKRLIEQGGVEIDSVRAEPNEDIKLEENSIVKVGKRKFVKIKSAH